MKNTLIVCLLFLISGCASVTSRMGLNALFHHSRANYVLEAAVMHLDTLRNREVIFLPMVHVGKEADYEKIKLYLDLKKSQGYTIFYEGLLPIDSVDYANLNFIAGDSTLKADLLAKVDTISRKFRRLTGFHLSSIENQYTDPDNKSIRRNVRKDFVTQSKALLGLTADSLNTHNEIWVDMTEPELLRLYEREYKPIELTAYDWDTPLNAEYNTPDTVKHSEFAFVQEFRNKYISNRVLGSTYPKIVMVYGAGHYWFIWAELRDAGYIWDEKYRAHKELKDYTN